MSSETSTFERYDDEFNCLIQQIESKLHVNDVEANEVSNDLNHQQLLKQCDDLLKQMSLEARSIPSNNATLKRSLLERVKLYKTKYQALQSESDRMEMLGGRGSGHGGNDPHNNSREQKERLLQTEDQLGRQNDTLERARRTMMETEQVALEISDELASNRAKLSGAHGRIREMTGLTNRARRVLTSMSQRATQQKMIVYGVMVTLIVGFFVLLYTMWR